MNYTVLTDMFFMVLGGLSIFLLGMHNMSNGMQAIAGNKMRQLINAVTNNRIMAVTVGFFVTAIIQSSSVTSVMVVGFVNAELMTLTQALGVILGGCPRIIIKLLFQAISVRNFYKFNYEKSFISL